MAWFLEIPDDWVPSPENINKLPKPIRDYIHDVATGDLATAVRDRAIALDTMRSLQEAGKELLTAIQCLIHRHPSGTLTLCVEELQRHVRLNLDLFNAPKRVWAGEGSGDEHVTQDGWVTPE